MDGHPDLPRGRASASLEREEGREGANKERMATPCLSPAILPLLLLHLIPLPLPRLLQRIPPFLVVLQHRQFPRLLPVLIFFVFLLFVNIVTIILLCLLFLFCQPPLLHLMLLLPSNDDNEA